MRTFQLPARLELSQVQAGGRRLCPSASLACRRPVPRCARPPSPDARATPAQSRRSRHAPFLGGAEAESAVSPRRGFRSRRASASAHRGFGTETAASASAGRRLPSQGRQRPGFRRTECGGWTRELGLLRFCPAAGLHGPGSTAKGHWPGPSYRLPASGLRHPPCPHRLPPRGSPPLRPASEWNRARSCTGIRRALGPLQSGPGQTPRRLGPVAGRPGLGGAEVPVPRRGGVPRPVASPRLLDADSDPGQADSDPGQADSVPSQADSDERACGSASHARRLRNAQARAVQPESG